MGMNKKCSKCKTLKNPKEFYSKNSKHCKSCVSEAVARMPKKEFKKNCSKCGGPWDDSSHYSWCKNCARKYIVLWREKNYEHFYKQVAARNLEIRKEVLAYYSPGGIVQCVCCSIPNYEFMTIEHSSGNGSKHRKELKRHGVNFLKWLKAQGFPPGYEVLCFNCQYALGTYGKCPHGKTANYAWRKKRFAYELA